MKKPVGKHLKRYIAILCCTVALVKVTGFAQAQADSMVWSAPKTLLVASAGTVVSVGTLIGLSELWFADQPRTSFRYFNDNADWLQLDKVGHATSSYYLGRIGMRSLQWTGTSRKNAILFGGTFGFVYLTAVEVLDGFSAAYGFSAGDMVANALGTGVFISQELLWREQRMVLKYSANLSDYAQYRPEVLGSSVIERLLKDYNGQSYWLSVNAASWFKEKPNWLPGWINVAIGYSGDGMLGGSGNPEFNAAGDLLPTFNRQRQFFLSLDVDLTRIKTKSKVLRTCFELFNIVKIPAPAIEVNQSGKFAGHWVYF